MRRNRRTSQLRRSKHIMESLLAKYPHIPFNRKEVSKRIKETNALLKKLKLIAQHPDQKHKLFLDESTQAYWQLAYAWNWGAKPYRFLVPSIRVDGWQKERYVDPDELLIYVASMNAFSFDLENNTSTMFGYLADAPLLRSGSDGMTRLEGIEAPGFPSSRTNKTICFR